VSTACSSERVGDGVRECGWARVHVRKGGVFAWMETGACVRRICERNSNFPVQKKVVYNLETLKPAQWGWAWGAALIFVTAEAVAR
jgi:hypothetical protein